MLNLLSVNKITLSVYVEIKVAQKVKVQIFSNLAKVQKKGVKTKYKKCTGKKAGKSTVFSALFQYTFLNGKAILHEASVKKTDYKGFFLTDF